MIIILGEKADPQCQSIATKLEKLNREHRIFDSATFPAEQTISYSPSNGEMILKLKNESFSVDQIDSLYWRTYNQPKIDGNSPLAIADANSLLTSFLTLLGNKSINSAASIRFHREKPRQLAEVAAAGISIPESYMGNDAEQIKQFITKYGKCIFKPVVGGDYAQVITEAHLAQEHLNVALAKSPISLQRFVEGTNIRSYVIDGQVYSAEIASSNEDFRLDPNACLTPIDVPNKIEQQAILTANILGLAWTAIDWRRDTQGKYFFLEANPSPMFVNFESMTGLPISEKLANLLAKKQEYS